MENNMSSRRKFLKLGMVSAATVFAGKRALALANDIRRKNIVIQRTPRQYIPTACWQCVTRCPVVGEVAFGTLLKIGGQAKSIRTEGALCAKGQAGVNQLYDPDRVLYPLKRVGARGGGRWEKISWDQALHEVVSRLKPLRDAGHPEKFMFHYGRMKASSSKLIKSLFLANYGTKTIGNHTSICEGGKWTAQELTWGKHYDNWDVDQTRYILNFGSNCLEAHTNHTPIALRISRALVDQAVKMVTFDVRYSNTAAKSNEWFPIKPGTDGAVALAMCQHIMAKDLYRGEGEAFLKFCKVTQDRKASLVEKIDALKTHLQQYTPEWAEGISGVPAQKIREIAREFATTKPAVVISYRGAVAHYNGNDTERAIQMLAAITGNIDNPGGRCLAVGAKWKYPKGPKNKPKAKKLQIIDGFPGQAALPTHHISHQVLKMIKDGRAGRPDVYMWYCYQPVYSNGNVQENIDVLKDESLIPYTVCVSPFYDESAALADLILPDTTYLERWDWEDMVCPNQIAEYALRQPMVKPLGEVRDFGDVCCELAERMGFPLGVSSKEEFVRKSCEMTPGIKEAGGFEFMKKAGVWHDPKAKPRYFSYKKEISQKKRSQDTIVFDEASGVYWDWTKSKAKSLAAAKAKGYAHTKNAYKGYVGQEIEGVVYAGFKPDKLNKSGYFELYSQIMAEKGFAPLPTYIPIPEHETATQNQLILTTFKVNAQTHSRTQNCKWLTEIYHNNPAWINPLTAQAQGILHGDRLRLRSQIGSLETKAHVTPAVAPGVISISFHCGHWQYGRWASGKKPPHEVEQDADFARKWWDEVGAHPNWIIPNRVDPINGQHRWMDTLVTLEKV